MEPIATGSLSDAPPIELRVLHGPQAGSRLALESSQTYTVGSGDDCAVLLSGVQVESEHVAIEGTPSGIRITPLEGKVTTSVDGDLAGEATVPLGTIIQIGRVMLTVDLSAAPWPQDETLEPVRSEPPVMSEPAPDEMPINADVASIRPSEPALPMKKGRQARILVAGVAAALSLLGAAAAALVYDGHGESEGETIRPSPVPIQVVSEPAAQTPAHATPAMPTVRAMTPKERAAAAASFLQKKQVPGALELHVELGEADTLRIVGAAATQASLTLVVEQLKSEVAQVEPVEVMVLLPEQLKLRFREGLRSTGLTTRLKVMRESPDFFLKGVLTPQERSRWESFFVNFARAYGSVLTVHAEIREERDELAASIEAVVGGSMPYIVTTDGRRVAAGGTMSGRTVAAIRDGEIVFADGMRVRYTQ